jgi:hypothetical protein
MVATGVDGASVAAATEVVRAQIAFYASTPAYRVVLEVHGWGELQPRLRELTRRGDWAAMAAEVPDELLHEVAVVAPPGAVAAEIVRRFGSRLDRVALNAPYTTDPDVWRQIAAELRAR